MPTRNLFATFIGINAYPQNPLSGCIKDVLNMDLFLREYKAQQDGLAYEPLYFLAPRANDKELIEEHFASNNIDEKKIRSATFSLRSGGSSNIARPPSARPAGSRCGTTPACRKAARSRSTTIR